MSKRWFLVTLGLSCVTLLALIFSLWELVEHRYFRDLDYTTLHYLYITRGIASSLLIGAWATWFVLSDRRRHEAQLEESYARYRSILNHMPEAVVLFDERFQVWEWNQAAEQLYGLTREEVVGGRLPIVPAEQWEELERVVTPLNSTVELLDYETTRLTASGGQIPVAVSYSRVPWPGRESPFFVEVAQDIRPRRQMRDKLVEIEKLTLMGQMAAGTAHHLNTPLTAMLLQLEMLRRRVQDLQKSRELEVIEKQIRFCQVFVHHLLQFSRRPHFQPKPIAVCDLLEGIGTLLRPSLTLKKAGLRIDLDCLRHCHVLGDSNLLEAMFSALVSNAVDAIPLGGEIHIHGSLGADHRTEICVDDTGLGIPHDVLPRVFEPFFTTKPAGKGTGLGLAIARTIAEQHSGALHLCNLPGGGLRAVVQLPLAEPGDSGPSAEKGKKV